jgi:hypothetical protein
VAQRLFEPWLQIADLPLAGTTTNGGSGR